MLNKKLGKYLPILALSLLGTKKYYMHWADNKVYSLRQMLWWMPGSGSAISHSLGI